MNDVEINGLPTLKDSLFLLEKLSANVPGMIYQFRLFADGRTCFTYASSKIEEIYEVTFKQVKDDASIIYERIHPSDLHQLGVSIQESARTLSAWKHEYRIELPARGLRWLRGEALPEQLADGSFTWHGFITDITDEKNALVLNIQREKMKTLGEMSAGIAHEINNPLAILKGKISIILHEIESKNITMDEVAAKIKLLDLTIERISKIIRGLRSFARDSSQDPLQTTLIKDLLDDSLSLCQARFKGNDVKLELSEFDPALNVSCRPSQISQVIVNLLCNAFDAVKDLEDKWIKVSVEADDAFYYISILDSGSGIPQNIRDKILHPFFTTKETGQGTGLGLSISLGILKAQGGDLELDNESPNTRFIIKLPRQKLA